MSYETGFYWVKFDGAWWVAERYADQWLDGWCLTGSDVRRKTDVFSEIGPKIEPPTVAKRKRPCLNDLITRT
jgi:hypothetical protein